MTNRTLQKLSRKELLEVMISQGEEIERLQEQLNIANQKLDEREMDVIFLLDFSGSMSSVANQAGSDIERWMVAVDAVNESMQQVLDANPENRVGVVVFSNVALTVLPLGRYVVDTKSVPSYYDPGILSYITGSAYKTWDSQVNRYVYDANRSTLVTNEALYYEKEGEPGDWALTLFTCTVSGSYRVTVRCTLV